MDAKPQRPLRSTRIHDENAIPAPVGAGKAVHQRHKSTPALSNLMQIGAVKGQAQKRAAFADVSNQRTVQPAKDDSAINCKNDVKSKTGIAIQVLEPIVKEQPLARKPQRTATLKALTSLPTAPNQLNNAVSSKPVTSEVPRDIQPSVIQKHIAALPKTQVEPSIDEILKEHDRLCAENLLGEALNQALGKGQHAEPSLLPTVNVPAQLPPHVLPSQAQVNNHNELASAYLPPASAFPDTHEQAQAALQSILRQEQQHQGAQQGYYESDYEGTSYDGDYTTHKSLGMVSDTTGGATILLAPKYTTKIKHEIAEAKEFVELHRSPEDIEDDHWDTSMVAEYGDEIFEYMRTLEERMRPNPHYMDHQTECQWSMRAVLLDWLVQVHARFTLLPETLFLSVNYIDRFLSTKVVSLAKLQLVGATALFLAAKYEEVNCPSISEIVYMVDNGYSMDEILKAERFMLSMLAFELGWPGPMSFLRRISKADDYDLETRTLAKYFLEVTIMDERFLACPPSSTAAAAHCLARLMLHKGEWTKPHVYYSNYTYDQLRPLISVIVECCENPAQHHNAVYQKYQDKRYKKSAFFVQQEMQNGFRLPPAQNRTSSFGMVDLSISQGWRNFS
ncbi:hypothetical protein ANO11243_070590 [Dothideomycetidae sp. 11243]|nr:hypothetical protein ANO11243_070590 [fungal sp. No.11243]